ncbi:MAG: aminoacyl-tRNA hydrolase [Alphaproteobacteria bacterium]
MKLVVGLGNPGAEYEKNRHNIGFMAIDRLHEFWRGGAWKKKFHGLFAEASVDGEKILLLKPMTFMNVSGRAVIEAASFYKIAPQDILVFHDEIELLPGKIRIKQGGGAAGHNGLKSIDAAIGADYWRVRMGVGRPAEGKDAVHGYVLGNFSKADRAWLDPLLDVLAKEAALLLAGDHGRYMNRANLALKPQKES